MNFKTRFATVVISLFLTTTVFGYGLGISTHPLAPQDKYITTEYTGLMSKASGKGLQIRYAYSINPELTVEGGGGVSDGEFANRIFAGVDYTLFPDYQRQPKIIIRGSVENAEEFGERKNLLGIAPVISKGLNVYGQELFPYISLPLQLALNGESKEYRTKSRVALGMTAPLPIKNYNQFLANIEASINLKHAYTGLFVGLSYPLK